jgi:sugar lactone lactonase YvrE
MTAKIEVAVQGRDILGECPLWDERTGTLWWVDILAPALKQLDPASGAVKQNPLPEPMGSFAFRERGGLLAAMKSGIYLLDAAYSKVERLAAPEAGEPRKRFNDGRCDRQGRFWSGTMIDPGPREPTGALYRLEPGGACERMRTGITVPNSIAWSPDGRVMYFADSPRRKIWAFDYDPAGGVMSNERVFATTHPGYPDGSCVDADGCLWNAEYHGARVVRYTPAGKVDRVIELPAGNPTCCCFGGTRLDMLYITTASQDLQPEELAKQPLAGSVLAVRPGSTGLPESRFTG